MRRALFWTCLLAGTLLAMVLPSAAADAEVVDPEVRDIDGVLLSHVPLRSTVFLSAQIENTGTTDFNGTITVVFHVTRAGTPAYDWNETAAYTVSLAPGERIERNKSWAPSYLGQHTADIYVEGQTTFTQLLFDVTETRVPRGTLVERAFLDFGWFFAAFLGVAVLFAAVLRIRKPRT